MFEWIKNKFQIVVAVFIVTCLLLPNISQGDDSKSRSIALSVRSAIRTSPSAEDLIQELKSGKIPDLLMEEFRIVPEHSSATLEFQTHMEKEAAFLFQGNPALEGVKFRFLIADTADRNAFFLNYTSPPTIVFTKGLLKSLPSREQLLYVLGHEATHYRIAK